MWMDVYVKDEIHVIIPKRKKSSWMYVYMSSEKEKLQKSNMRCQDTIPEIDSSL